MSTKASMNPLTDDLYNERGEKDKADGLFYVERGVYRAILMAEKRAKGNRGRRNARKVVVEYSGNSARELATNLRAAGWTPPRRLAHLCESAPRSTLGARR